MRVELTNVPPVSEPAPSAPIDLELSLEDYEAAVVAAAERGLTLFEYVLCEIDTDSQGGRKGTFERVTPELPEAVEDYR